MMTLATKEFNQNPHGDGIFVRRDGCKKSFHKREGLDKMGGTT